MEIYQDIELLIRAEPRKGGIGFVFILLWRLRNRQRWPGLEANFYLLNIFCLYTKSSSELKTGELDTLNSDRLILISNMDTSEFCLIHSFPLFMNISTGFRPIKDTQIKRSWLRISHSRVFRSAFIRINPKVLKNFSSPFRCTLLVRVLEIHV